MARRLPDPPFGAPPSIEDIEAMAEEAFASVPDSLRKHCRNLVIRVDDFPDEETEDEMGLDSPFDILGLYRGVALTRRSVADSPQDMDMVFLFRRPILDYWCETGEDLGHVVRHVLIHEIGHHFGFSDAEMETIEAQVEL